MSGYADGVDVSVIVCTRNLVTRRRTIIERTDASETQMRFVDWLHLAGKSARPHFCPVLRKAAR